MDSNTTCPLAVSSIMGAMMHNHEARYVRRANSYRSQKLSVSDMTYPIRVELPLSYIAYIKSKQSAELGDAILNPMASLNCDGLTETLFPDTNHVLLFPSGVIVKTFFDTEY